MLGSGIGSTLYRGITWRFVISQVRGTPQIHYPDKTRKTPWEGRQVHDTNTDLVKELCVPSYANDTAIQEALIRLFNAQVRDQSETVVEEDQAVRAQRLVSESDQALKASVSDQISLVQSVSESKP